MLSRPKPHRSHLALYPRHCHHNRTTRHHRRRPESPECPIKKGTFPTIVACWMEKLHNQNYVLIQTQVFEYILASFSDSAQTVRLI